MKNYSKYGKGWFKESERHRLARMGIKTGRKTDYSLGIGYAKEIREIKKATTYTDGEFEYTFSPIEDTINVIKVADGYIVKYLTRDEDPESPDALGDDNLFLVHYHRDFQVENKNIITEDDARDFYQGNKIEQEKDYYIIPIEAYIHSGVSLAISQEGDFPDRQWDVSHVGLALASKKEFKSKKQAEKAIRGLVESWNQYLGGDVYSIVAEKYDNNKEQVDYDVVGGYYGFEEAKKELKGFKYGTFTKSPQKKITEFSKINYMLGASYPTKKSLKESIGKPLRYVETSMFGQEYKPNGTLTVVGPDPYTKRDWYATVTMKDGKIQSVK